MMIKNSISKILCLLILSICLLCTQSNKVYAAFPIKTTELVENKNEKSKKIEKSEEKKSFYQTEPKQESKRKEDSGILGILAFVFGLTGLFPAAIVLGILGSERHRKFKELAIAGLVLGLVTLLIYAFAFALILGLL